MGNNDIKNINVELEKNLTIHDRIARWITCKVGSMSFIYLLILFVVLWIISNVALISFGLACFDTPYTFPILLMASNIIQLIIPMFILVSQNLQEQRSSKLADNKYLLDKKISENTDLTFEHLRNLGSQLNVILNQLKINQNKMIDVDRNQFESYKIVIDDLIGMISDLVKTFSERPCLMEDIQDLEKIKLHLEQVTSVVEKLVFYEKKE